MTVLELNPIGLKLDVVVTDQEEADKLKKLGHITVGFISCPKWKVMVVRCHQYLHGLAALPRTAKQEINWPTATNATKLVTELQNAQIQQNVSCVRR